jgi:Flp pilus assembly protein TadD
MSGKAKILGYCDQDYPFVLEEAQTRLPLEYADEKDDDETIKGKIVEILEENADYSFGIPKEFRAKDLAFFIRPVREMNPQAAIEMLHLATQLYPDDHLLWFQYGKTLYYDGYIGNARDAFLKTIELHPEDREAPEYLKRIDGIGMPPPRYHDVGSFEGRRSAGQTDKPLPATSRPSLRAPATPSRREQTSFQAPADRRVASPASPKVFFDKAREQREAGDRTGEIKTLLKGIQKHGDNVGLWHKLGQAYFSTNQFGKAVTALKKAQSLSPDDDAIARHLRGAQSRAGGSGGQRYDKN